MLREQKEAGRQNQSPARVILDSAKRRETKGGEQQGERTGGAGGVKRQQHRRGGMKTSVDSDRKKTEAAHVPMSPQPDPLYTPYTQPPLHCRQAYVC